MFGAQETANSLHQLRNIDRSQQLTRIGDSLMICPLVEQGSVSLLNALDSVSLNPQIVFLARALFVSYIKSLGDIPAQQTTIDKILRTSLLTGYETLNPQVPIDGFQVQILDLNLHQYFESQEYQQMKAQVVEVAGYDLNLASPEDFLKVAKGSLGQKKYLKAISEIVNFALSCADSCDYTAEEIFVACSLVTCEKSGTPLPQFEAWLNEFFTGSLVKGHELKEKLIATLQEYTAGSDE